MQESYAEQQRSLDVMRAQLERNGQEPSKRSKRLRWKKSTKTSHRSERKKQNERLEKANAGLNGNSTAPMGQGCSDAKYDAKKRLTSKLQETQKIAERYQRTINDLPQLKGTSKANPRHNAAAAQREPGKRFRTWWATSPRFERLHFLIRRRRRGVVLPHCQAA